MCCAVVRSACMCCAYVLCLFEFCLCAWGCASCVCVCKLTSRKPDVRKSNAMSIANTNANVFRLNMCACDVFLVFAETFNGI